ncbi:MAG: DUF1846 domain-containing protein [Kiritimatiellia bacterium]|nr:DUF1846 domain-containing protein [Kiritimatiellia bacterium]
MRAIGFDNEKYLEEQTAEILRRADQFGNKLYLEFGGKLMYDYHAARCLPGYDPNVKLRLLRRLKENAEIILCIYAGDIERKKMRADFGISYESDAMKLIDDLRSWELSVCGVVITRFEGQPSAVQFKNKLERRGIRVYCHKKVPGYPNDVELIVSEHGYGANEYVPTSKPIVVVTGPGPGSGKLATALTMLYHDCRNGRPAGYAKFETFPVWNIPLKHPLNLAYEAATADLRDVNLIDPFHLEAHGEVAVNYNRDVEAFPVLRAIWNRIDSRNRCPYQSPTDMGVNRIGFGIVDDAVVREASRQEIIRRHFRHLCDATRNGLVETCAIDRIDTLMKDLGITPEDRRVVLPARQAAQEAAAQGRGATAGAACGGAIELADGRIVTGKNSPSLHAASATILNAVKVAAGIDDGCYLLAPEVVASIVKMKHEILKNKYSSLNLDETLIGLAMSAAMAGGDAAKRALGALPALRSCEMHVSHLLTPGDEAGLRRLGIRYTTDPLFSTAELFIDG